ncbi:MAG: hypothetical protein ACLFVU_08765 [Phycisphaerae bacterium]
MAGKPSSEKKKDARSKPRRLWLKILVVVLVVLVLLVFLAPYLASTGVGESLVRNQINSRIRGNVTFDDLSISWFGPTRIEGFTLEDPESRKVLQADLIELAGGAWDLLVAAEDFDNLLVQSPTITLYMEEEDAASIEPAVDSPKPAEPEKPDQPSTLPMLRGAFQVQSGTIAVVFADGQQLLIRNVNSTVTLDTLDDVVAELSAETAGGKTITADLKVRDLTHNGELSLRSAQGTGLLNVEEGIPIDLLATLITDQPINGDFGGKVELQIKDGQAVTGGNFKMVRVSAPRLGTGSVRPIDGQLMINATYKTGGEIISDGTVQFSRAERTEPAGDLKAEFVYRPTPGPMDLTAERVFQAILGGASINLPHLKLQANGSADMVVLSDALPGLIRLREGVQVTSGTVTLNLDANTVDQVPHSQATLDLSGLAARRENETYLLENITTKVDISLPDTGLTIARADLTGPFGTVKTNGTIDELTSRFDFDLARGQQKLQQVFDFGRTELAGTLNGSLNVKRQEDVLTVVADANGRQLRIRQGERSVVLRELRLREDGTLTLKNRTEPERFDLRRAFLTLDGETVADVNGFYRFEDGKMQGTLTKAVLDIDHLRQQAENLDLAFLTRLGGKLTLFATAGRDSSDKPITFSGSGSLANLRVDREPLLAGDKPVELDVKSGTYDPSAKRLTVGSAAVTGPSMTANLKSLVVSTGDSPGLSGSLEGSMQLAQLKPVGAVMEVPALERLAGQSRFTVSVRQEQDGALVSQGKLTVEDLAVDGKPVGPEQRETVVQWTDASVTPARRQMQLASAELSNGLASASVKKVSADWSQQIRLEGSGNLSADLRRVLETLARLGEEKQEPAAIAGLLTAKGQFRTEEGNIRFDGDGSVDDLVVGSGEKIFREDKATFAVRATARPDTKTIDLTKATVSSRLLNADAGGTVRDYDKRMLLDLAGNYKGDWEYITTLLHELAPAAKGKASFAGTTEGQFVVRGPAARPGVYPEYKGVTGQTKISWDSANFMGVRAGKAVMTPTMEDGVVKLPMTEVPTDENGKIRLMGSLDLTERKRDPKTGQWVATPRLIIPGKLQVLEGVPISEQLGRELSWVIPLLYSMVQVEGKADLQLEDLDLPLSAAGLLEGRGSGRLKLENLRIRPGGFSSKIFSLLGMDDGGKSYPLSISGVDFKIADGKLRYDRCVIGLGEGRQINLAGAISYDEQLNMTMEFPVTPQLLKQFGVKNARAMEYMSVLQGVSLPIPLHGTVSNPKLDLSKVDVKPLINKAVRNLLLKKGTDLLGNGDEKPTAQPTTQPKKQSAEEELIEGVFDLLNGRKRRPNQSPAPEDETTTAPTTQAEEKSTEERVIEGIFDIIDKRTRREDD